MPLHAVLSVLSEAIQRDASPEEVAELINNADLSVEERDDLRRIPFERLEPYQSDIYSAERGMLEWGFTNTWRCLHQLNFGAGDSEIYPERPFVMAFKRRFPCPSHSVREMGGLFLRYLTHEEGLLCTRYPWLPELAEAERLEIEVLYAEDNPLGRALGDDAREAFFAQSLEDVLSSAVVRAEKVVVRAWQYDFTGIKDAISLAEQDGSEIDFEAPPFQAPAAAVYLGIARDPQSLTPCWYNALEADAVGIPLVPEDTPLSVEVLAAHVLPHLVDPAADEEAQLAAFLFWLDRAFRLRFLLLA